MPRHIMLLSICRGTNYMQRVRKQIEAEWGRQEPWMDDAVTIAVLDTGIGRHPDLTGKLLGFRDFVKQRNLMYDNNGHGTHVCGLKTCKEIAVVYSVPPSNSATIRFNLSICSADRFFLLNSEAKSLSTEPSKTFCSNSFVSSTCTSSRGIRA